MENADLETRKNIASTWVKESWDERHDRAGVLYRKKHRPRGINYKKTCAQCEHFEFFEYSKSDGYCKIAFTNSLARKTNNVSISWPANSFACKREFKPLWDDKNKTN